VTPDQIRERELARARAASTDGLVETIRDVLDRHVNHERSASFHVALDVLAERAEATMSYAEENSAITDQTPSTLDTGQRPDDDHVRFICNRCHNDVGWVPAGTSVCPICNASPLATSVFVDVGRNP
jgi:hypothetical protein